MYYFDFGFRYSTGMVVGHTSHTNRGSGSSGYVQKNFSNDSQNLAHFTARELKEKQAAWNEEKRKLEKNQAEATSSLLSREVLRRIEVQCAELEDELEDEGFGQDEITARVNNLRNKLYNEHGNNGEKQSAKEEPDSSENISLLQSADSVYQYKPRFS